MILRNEDIDRARCKPEFVSAMIEDLDWFGFQWQEGPDHGGPHAPYNQGERYALYRDALQKLKAAGHAYPCTCSRKDIQAAASAPQGADDEVIYPGTCRGHAGTGTQRSNVGNRTSKPRIQRSAIGAEKLEIGNRKSEMCWRFRVPDGERIRFVDGRMGEQQFIAGVDFGDFVLWRNDDVPAYQLAVVVDDDAMEITEVVRGEDLLVSTARQLLLYRALGLQAPAFFHCPLVTDDQGARLAKRNDAMSLRTLRQRGISPEQLRTGW